MRYVHELCLMRLRTESTRAGSLWTCHQCGHDFNLQRLTIHKILSSKLSSGVAAVWVMLIVMFFLGFIADPIINLYEDPYYTLVEQDYWAEVPVVRADGPVSSWLIHFMKGLVSMGFIGFMKVMLLNPWNWWNLRQTGLIGNRGRTGTTGRDRASNIQWIAVAIGVGSAFYFFYQMVQTVIGRALTRLGDKIVDTQLPRDDDDLKPPAGYKPQETGPGVRATTTANGGQEDVDVSLKQESPSPGSGVQTESYNGDKTPSEDVAQDDRIEARPLEGKAASMSESEQPEHQAGISIGPQARRSHAEIRQENRGCSSALDEAQSQGWTFVGIT